MERNTVLLQDTEAFMHGELDNVTVQQNCIVLDLVQGGYVPYGCYTSAPIPMPLFDALRVSWNAASPEDTAVEAQVRVMVDGNWTPWNSFGKWSPSLHREGPPYQARGPVQRWPDRLQLDSKYATAVQLRIYLYSKNEKVSPAVMLLGASVRVVDVIPARRAARQRTAAPDALHGGPPRPGAAALDGRGDLAGQPDEPLGRRSAARGVRPGAARLARTR